MPSDFTTEAEVNELAQVIRTAHVMTQIGRNSGFGMVGWDTLSGREKAPYVASAVAAIRHLKVEGPPREPTDAMLWAAYQADMGTENTFEDFMTLCPGWREDQRVVWRAMLEALKNEHPR